MTRVMVTGVNGFVGKHLARVLKSQQLKVIGVGREPDLHAELFGVVDRYHACDLTNQTDVSGLPLYQIDSIISLAGLAQVGASFTNPESYKHINVAVLEVFGDELLKQNLSPRVVVVSTGAVYDNAQPMPLTEESLLIKDGSPYALSKIAMEKSAHKLRTRGLDCIVVRPFNHIGPGQEPGFLVPDLRAKITAADSTDGLVKVGNLNTRRDYTDVRDVVRAYATLAQTTKLKHFIYNVCSGKSIPGETVLKTLIAASKAEGKIQIEQDPALIRPNDPLDLYGSNQRLFEDTGWQPQIPFEQTIKDFVASSI